MSGTLCDTMVKKNHPGLVSKGKLETSIGDLEIESDDCVDTVGMSSFGEVKLHLSLNHKSEDMKMTMSYRLSPDDARSLAELLVRAAESAEDNPYSHEF
jgi:hypothetical protein